MSQLDPEAEHRLVQEVTAAPCRVAATRAFIAFLARHGVEPEDLTEDLCETLKDLIAAKPE